MILTVTLNVALDHLIFLPKLEVNAINRIDQSTIIPGGKGINIASSLAVLGDEVIATGFIGGKDSNYLEGILQQLGVTTNFLYIDDEIRTDTYIVETGPKVNSLIIEKGVFIQSRYIKSFLANYKRVLNNVDTVVIAGSLPPGIEISFIGELIDIANYRDNKVVLNCREEILKKNIIRRRFKIVKPDVRDADTFLDMDYKQLGNRKKMGESIVKRGAEIFIINYDNLKYFVYAQEKCFEVYYKKEIKDIKSLVGMEDAFLGAFLYKSNQHFCIEDSAKYGVAAAISTGFSVNNYPESKEDMEKYLENISVKNIK